MEYTGAGGHGAFARRAHCYRCCCVPQPGPAQVRVQQQYASITSILAV